EHHIGTHRRAEHYATIFGLIWIAGLTVMRHDDRLMSLEPQPDDAGQRSIDEAQPHPLAGFHRNSAPNAPVDRDGVADAARHPRFHAIAEPACNASLIVEPPILNEPYEVSINGDRLGFLDDQRPGQTAPKLLQRVGMRVIPERPRVRRGELVDEALAGPDRLL